MNAIKLNNDQKMNQIEIIQEKDYIDRTFFQRKKIVCYKKPSSKNIRRKRVLFKSFKREASNTSVPFHVIKINCKQKIEWKDKNY